jgi:beta-lysine 5,6-aminomutase beta subunit
MNLLKPYGDTLGDGALQLSFTLPIAWNERADEAARRLVVAMGFHDVVIAEGRAIAEHFSFFVVYAKTSASVDVEQIPAQVRNDATLAMDDVDALIRERLKRKIRVAGACIGTDAHTVGIDAILNMKGYHGDYGLERYREFVVFNLGSQVGPDEFVRFVVKNDIEVILASQIVTQKGSDITNFTALSERLEMEGLRDRVLLLCGGPRMTNLLAVELGYDAGFGRGTLPSDVATFIVRSLIRRSNPL